MNVTADVVAILALAAAFVAQMLRWLRVLQREHYEASSMSRFLGRWSSPQVGSAKLSPRLGSKRPITLSHILVVGLVVAVLLHLDGVVIFVAVLYGLFCPVGLSLKGRTGELQWTRRLTTIAVVSTSASLLAAAFGAVTVRPWLAAVAMVWAVPVTLELSARVLGPYEGRRAQKFVDQAVARLHRVAPRIVAITGSYGKTSTKNHLVDLLRSDGGVVSSPRSFNNRAGLSRTINENLADDTQIFIAEMGTYGPGEIRELCAWCVPEIAVVTAIGPVHLERMKTLAVIEEAKFEITESAKTVVINIDDARLARWRDRLVPNGKKVRTVGSLSEAASIRVVVNKESWTIIVDGEELFVIEPVVGVQPTNLACALGVAIEIGVPTSVLKDRVANVRTVANRLNVVTATSGVVVIDDTFNSNPASALAALAALMNVGLPGRRVVVTPGMIELGRDQYAENLSFAKQVASTNTELVIVGRTNVKPLEAGFGRPCRRFDVRDEAVAWVRSALVPGDGVLYLNDLPDHYP